MLVVGLCVSACAAPASAHPLGNFTINHLVKVHVAAQRVHIHYVLDIAEIPTFQIIRSASAVGSGSRQQLDAWAQRERATVISGLQIEVDGATLALQPRPAVVATRPGAGGLPTIYWTDDLSAALPRHAGQPITLRIADRTYDNRIGWRDIVAAPNAEPTDELRHYPSALLGSPRDVREMALTLSAAGNVLRAADTSQMHGSRAPARALVRTGALSDMLSRGSHSPLWVLLTLLVAIGLGMLHALEPGHGKTLLAVSLVGARATTKQALLLAVALTLAHTTGVLALGVVLVFAAGWIVPESIYPWMTLVSGVVVAFMGARALARLARTYRAGHDHERGHDRLHAHAHDHSHGHDHDDAIAADRPLSFRNVVLIAMSGNIAPCPAALVVLLAALALHEVAFGLAVVIAFSIGLAAVLTGLGIALVRSADWIAKRPHFDKLAVYAPIASACIISAIGAVMLAQGAAAAAFTAPPMAVVALTLTAIAGFALSPSHAHSHAHAHDRRQPLQPHDQGAAS